MEDDENSKFFHGIVNNNKRKNRIHELNIDGVWLKEPCRLKYEVWYFSQEKLDEPLYNRPKLISYRFKRFLNLVPFSEMEIKDAIWCCGNDNVP